MKRKYKRILFIILIMTLLLSTGAYALTCPFPDAHGHWAEAIIDTLSVNGVIEGYADGTVRPDDVITRGEFAALLVRHMELERIESGEEGAAFDDTDGNWSEVNICSLINAGILSPEDYDGSFSPNAPITRIEIIRMIVRALNKSIEAEQYRGNTLFSDDSEIDSSDKGIIYYAAHYRLIKGYPDNTIRPDGVSTRAEAFTLLLRQDEALKIIEAESKTADSDVDSDVINPAAQVVFDLPVTAHTDSCISIEPTVKYAESLSWSLTKETSDGSQKPVELLDSLVGSLTIDGGIITFKDSGNYTLTATAVNSVSRETIFSTHITVYPVIDVSFDLPETIYTDTSVDLTTQSAMDGPAIEWTLTNDEASTASFEYIEYPFNNQGGKIRFTNVGEYVITASTTDIVGRTFTYSNSIKVYPIPIIFLTLPSTSYTGESTIVSVSGTDLDNLTSSWTFSKDDCEAVPYSDYTSGDLGNSGGSLMFRLKGTYVLTLIMTDVLGRTYSESATIAISPMPEMQISVPQLNYSEDIISVNTSGSELDGMDIVWRISLDDGTAEPYSQNASGTLSADGGEISISTEKTIIVKLIATATDDNGRRFIFESNTATLKPIPQFCFVLPLSTHVGTTFNVTLQNVSGLEDNGIVWSMTKNSITANYSGNLDKSGGSISLRTTGIYTLTATVTNDVGRMFAHSEIVSITNTAPNAPTTSASVTRTVCNGKFLVNLTASAVDSDGDTMIYEYVGNNPDGYYAVGSYAVKVRATDAFGMYSNWSDISFTVENLAPSTPIISRSPDGNSVAPGTAITITAFSTDPEGDAFTYVWEGRNSETQTYSIGKNTIKVKAVDAAGAESPWTAIVFFVSDSTSGGGMTLSGPESVILEEGLEGATITGYTFTVPPVSGHSGADYGSVRGFNILTGQWEQLDYQTTTNGITFTRTLPAGVYSQLEFYYYTNHTCMYNKSNITYSVNYYFE